jgi:hypothetical protein
VLNQSNRTLFVNRFAWATLLVLFTTSGFAADAKPQYFTNVRSIQVPPASEAAYIVVDEDLWSHARPDLGDLRLYNHGQAVPYALRVMGNNEVTEQRPVKILNKGIVSGATQFLLDMNGIDVYDQVTLQIAQHDFDRVATVEGANEPDARTWTLLTVAPVFDFAKQKLGSNLTVSLPESNFRFLRVSISGKGVDRGNDVLPANLDAASACNTFRTAAIWDTVPTGELARDVKSHDSTLRFDMPKSVPVDRLQLAIADDRVNFRRPVTVEVRADDTHYKSDEEGWFTVASGTLTRIRYFGGKLHEELLIPTHDTRAPHWRVTIHNGDDPPLPLTMTAQSLERRVYFEPHGATALQLYYGDEKLESPEYDYSKFFRDAEAKNAGLAFLEASVHNPQYTGRPDERPWSERNNWVLWAALVAAVVGIGAVALGGMKKA